MDNSSRSRSKHVFQGLLLKRVLCNPQTSAENKKVRSHWNYFSLCFLKRRCITSKLEVTLMVNFTCSLFICNGFAFIVISPVT